MLKYFKFDLNVTVIAIAVAYILGMPTHNSMEVVSKVIVLAILETSLSFDNAIINASILRHMSDVWRHRFLTWGMLIAVFGMRVLFPLIIIMINGHVGPLEALDMALFQPTEYELLMKSAHVGIAAFGGSFLMMVALKYFMNHEKDVHWIKFIERPLSHIGKIEGFELALTMLVLYLTSLVIPQHEVSTLFTSGIFGLIIYILVDGLGALLETPNLAMTTAKSGLASFLYLEVIDSSFSFDSVMASFAITDNMIIMALGLGIGALFVRSITIMMVEKGTLEAYKYLENGAFWSITFLACIMFVSLVHEVPEIVTGSVSVLLIGAAVISSKCCKK